MFILKSFKSCVLEVRFLKGIAGSNVGRIESWKVRRFGKEEKVERAESEGRTRKRLEGRRRNIGNGSIGVSKGKVFCREWLNFEVEWWFQGVERRGWLGGISAGYWKTSRLSPGFPGFPRYFDL